jgi:hypothetical protein
MLFPWLGLSLRDDAMERRNTAALVALLGARLAVQLTFAGVVRRWQQSGIAVPLKRLDAPGLSVPCEIGRSSWFGAMFQRALPMVGLHYGEAGGFGGWVTDTSAGG